MNESKAFPSVAHLNYLRQIQMPTDYEKQIHTLSLSTKSKYNPQSSRSKLKFGLAHENTAILEKLRDAPLYIGWQTNF